MCTKHDIRVIYAKDNQDLLDRVLEERLPAILRGLDIGECISKWDKDYLAIAVGSEEVKIHVSETPLLSFIEKNFLYKTLPFNELLKRACEDLHDNYFISEKEFYYLRSLGSNQRKEPADIRKQFSKLAEDIKFPSIIPENQIFSTVFRIASAGMSLWTHYDIMDNMLIQIRGKKRAVLFPPEESLKLYLDGDKSKVLDIDRPDLNKFPNFAGVQWFETILEEGDIIFIPALWFHNMKALEFGIAVNVFWKNLDDVLYDKKDPYGNKDLLPAQRASQLVDKALSALNKLPETYRTFYHKKLISQIQNKICTDK